MDKNAKVKSNICILIVVFFSMIISICLTGSITTINSSCKLNIDGHTVNIKVVQRILETDNTEEKLSKKLKFSGSTELCNSIDFGLIGVKSKTLNFSLVIAKTTYFFDASGFAIKPTASAYKPGSNYEISNVSQLLELQKNVNNNVATSGATFTLTRDINCGGNEFCIGNNDKPFSGNFLGNSHIISNLKIKSDNVGSGSGIGFFGNIRSVGKDINIEKIGFAGVTLSTSYTSSNRPTGIGILAGYLGCEACTNNAASKAHLNCYKNINISECQIRNCSIKVEFGDFSPYGLGIGSLIGACSSSSSVENIEAVNIKLIANWSMGYISQAYHNTGIGGIVGAQLGITTDAVGNSLHTRNLGKPIKLVISNSLFSGSIDWNTGEYQPFNICMGVGGILGSAWCADDYAYQSVEIKNTYSKFSAKGIILQKTSKAIVFDPVCFGSFAVGSTQTLSKYDSKIKSKNFTLTNNKFEIDNKTISWN